MRISDWSSDVCSSYLFKCEGIDLSVSTLADQVGTGVFAALPLYRLIEAHVLAAERLHGDDTTIPILATGRTVTGRIWVYGRDDRRIGRASCRERVWRYV